MAMGKSSGLRQLIGTTRDQLLDLLHALEERVACKKFEDFWCAKKFCCGFHPGFLLSREFVLCQLRRTHPFGSQPCAATGFFNSPSRRLRFLCDRVKRSGANCSMNPQIRARRHTPTGTPPGEHCRVSASRVKQKICKACGKLKGLRKKFDGVRGNERTTKPRSARRLGRTG